jgi:hypothetical protein
MLHALPVLYGSLFLSAVLIFPILLQALSLIHATHWSSSYVYSVLFLFSVLVLTWYCVFVLNFILGSYLLNIPFYFTPIMIVTIKNNYQKNLKETRVGKDGEKPEPSMLWKIEW